MLPVDARGKCGGRTLALELLRRGTCPPFSLIVLLQFSFLEIRVLLNFIDLFYFLIYNEMRHMLRRGYTFLYDEVFALCIRVSAN